MLAVGMRTVYDLHADGRHRVAYRVGRTTGEPETNRELFDRLAQHGWLSVELAATMGRMAGFRNIVVHGYGGVNLEIAKDIVEHRLADLTTFADAIRARLG